MTPAARPPFDVLVVGSGLAGLTAALLLAPTRRVALLTKQTLADSASAWAQGGIAAVMDKADSLDAHAEDTQVAGAGLCEPQATRQVVAQAPAAIAWLQSQGVRFSEEAGRLHLTREGGHRARRIVHATDATGAAVQEALLARVRERAGISITVFEGHLLVDLITVPVATGKRRCLGLQALDEASGAPVTLLAPHTVLATGGAGQVYLHTTNPPTATGDGIAAAWRAGCRVKNMEFIQFHPTCLYHPQGRNFLISEALRGEGGQLLLPDGRRFMPSHDPRAELAPRDIVARAIDTEMKQGGLDCVYLDMSHRGADFIRGHFPTIHAHCLALGIDITRAPIPVVPAAHYTCGGIVTDLRGRTDLAGLHAIGETACTGLHGANRLASNSLLECVVLARAAAQDILAHPLALPTESVQVAAPVCVPMQHGQMAGEDVQARRLAHSREALRRCMWTDVGIVRSDEGLARAARGIARLQEEAREAEEAGEAGGLTRERLELRNLLQVAALIVRSAMQRRESRGLHFNCNHPESLAEARPTVLLPSR